MSLACEQRKKAHVHRTFLMVKAELGVVTCPLAVHCRPLQHGRLLSSTLLHPLPQPMAAVLLLMFPTSGGLTVAMVTWQ